MRQKTVIQLDPDGYFVGTVTADESPLESDVYLLPANAIEADVPEIPENHRAKWDGSWIIESVPVDEEAGEEIPAIETLRWARDSLLSQSDWWVLPDRTPTQAQLDYRQALRDITDTYTSLDDVVWPEVPNE